MIDEEREQRREDHAECRWRNIEVFGLPPKYQWCWVYSEGNGLPPDCVFMSMLTDEGWSPTDHNPTHWWPVAMPPCRPYDICCDEIDGWWQTLRPSAT